MNKLLQLAERCEQATGPDAMLDIDICIAVEAYSKEGFARFGQSNLGYYIAHGSIALRYTASLDAAMTLVPEGWQCERMGWWAGAGAACLLFETHLVDGQWVREVGYLGRAQGEAATPALALCAATLRSQHMSREREDG